MYDKRVKIFVILLALLLLVCLLRLTQMQLRDDSYYQEQIAELKRQQGRSRQLETIRGKILDRNGRVLAADEPLFQLHINYKLSCYADERVRRAKLLQAAGKPNPDPALSNVKKELQTKLEDLQQITDKCVYFGLDREEVENKIEKINDRIWNLRTFQAWRQKCQKSDLFKEYKDNLFNVKRSDFVADFKKHCRNPIDRLTFINQTNIAEMYKNWPLLQLKTDDDIFTAQLEFMEIDGVQILSKAHRLYPYGSVAAQTIGWVGPAQPHDRRLFANDRLSSYLSDEVCGRRPGTEYVCETILRGRRGRIVTDIDRELVGKTKARFGKDVSLTLDIDLQRRIEQYLTDCNLNPNCQAPTAAVVIDVATADILALVSTPVFDLNRIRYDYADIESDPNEPLRNRAIYKQYPPGSVVKPLILITALESEKITPDEVISCPAQKAPATWPSCWLYNKYPWTGHDDKGQNNARNAIMGSCNIYFSRLADRIDPPVLRQWLSKFGYGHNILLPPAAVHKARHSRNLLQAAGIISSGNPKGQISMAERRYFGIGQGNLRVTPLQVANAMAAIARRGLYKLPRLFVSDPNDSKPQSDSTDLNISPQTLDLIYDGMSAVVNEPDGTAYNEFAPSGLAEQGVDVYGKTGSTEQPDHAWFAGFATDGTGRSISIAVVVEGGQHGSSDAGPLARDIIQFSIDAQYIGQTSN